jgi:hypothetical protein
MPLPHFPRYGMDFTLVFSVRTDNPDPESITNHEIEAGLLERVQELMAAGSAEVASACWPPTIFDGETGVTREIATDAEISDWRYEVENGDTRLGLYEWLEHRRDMEETMA